MLQVAGKSISFLLDMDATYSVLPAHLGLTVPSSVSVMGIDGSPFCPYKTLPLPCSAGGIIFAYSFLIIPSCPAPLLGQDILTKLGASITILPHPLEPLASHSLLLASAGHLAPPSPPGCAPPTLPILVSLIVWDTSIPIVATHHPHIRVSLKDPNQYPCRPQFPISEIHCKDIKPIIIKLLGQGLLIPINSPCNMPILPIRKPSRSYRLVQDLHIISEAIIPIHPWVPNPYTILYNIPPDTSHISVLDFKDSLFTIPLHLDSYFLFAFTWKDPDTHFTQQLTWTVLPQGFCDSSHPPFLPKLGKLYRWVPTSLQISQAGNTLNAAPGSSLNPI
jgi:hypothetical protein